MDPLPIQQDQHQWNIDMEKAFARGTVMDASPEDLQRWSAMLATWSVNTPVRGDGSSKMIRSLAINHAQSARVIKELEGTIERLNTASDKTQRRITLLTVVAVFLAFIQAVAAFMTIRDYLAKESQIHPDPVKKEINANNNNKQPLQPRE